MCVYGRYAPGCCGATVGIEQQHNQDLREIYKVGRILEFITFYRNALHLTTLWTRMHCAANNSNERASIVRCPDSEFLCGKFPTGRLEVLPNLRHAEVFQMSTMVNFGIGLHFKSLSWLVQALNLTRTEMSICSLTPQHGGYTNSSLLGGDVKVRKCHAMLFTAA